MSYMSEYHMFQNLHGRGVIETGQKLAGSPLEPLNTGVMFACFQILGTRPLTVK